MQKKICCLSLCIIILFSGFTSINAYQIGDVAGSTLYTDIIASINDYNIASYNINGYTAIVAEDLRNYGFEVQWLPNERSLHITRSSSNNVTSTYIAPSISSSQIGKKAQTVLYTDIKTYINGQEVTSYNIGGKTIIYFNDLAVFGSVNYNDTLRRLDLDISDGLNYKISAPYALSSSPVVPSGLYFKINSADGLQIRWTAKNNTNKTINYYTTTYYMFNSVGDFAYDYSGKNYFTIKTIGPVPNGGTLLDYTSKYEAEVYDAPVHDVMLYSIYIEYNDGTSEKIYYGHIGHEERGEYIL